MARKLVSNLVNVPLVTTLPTVTEATEIYYQSAAMATSGARWHLVYNPASASAYKWEFVGGAALFSRNTATATTASTVAVTLSNSPSVTLPALAGDYDITFGMTTWTLTTSSQTSMYIGYNGTADGVNYIQNSNEASSTGWNAGSPSAIVRKTAVAASTVITGMFGTSSGTANIWNVFVSVVPVRVG